MASIVAENLTVQFPYKYGGRSLLSSIGLKVGGVIGKPREAPENSAFVTALDNVSFNLRTGDRLGLIGHNGSGKSTLLQVLNGGLFPTKGNLETVGRISPLLNLGNGAAPELSGLDNILLLGLHAGMTRDEIRARQEEIVAFSELGDFIQLPIRTYSAGMYLRLSFAIATCINPEILLIDELFGAGDTGFYNKARKRMEELVEKSGILVFSTHAMGLVEMYCSKVMVLSHGKSVFIGAPMEAKKIYSEIITTGNR